MNDTAQPNAPQNNQAAGGNGVDPSYVDAYQPPGDRPAGQSADSAMPPQPSATVDNGAAAGGTSESLEDQNIFFLLGVTDGSEEEREEFLDELQQVIWEDFLQNDTQHLLTQEEFAKLREMLGDTARADLEQQEEIVVYLEKLIPDLEEVMLEKALQLKGDLFRERINGLKEYFAGQDEKMQQVNRAEEQLSMDQWYSAAVTLNNLS